MNQTFISSSFKSKIKIKNELHNFHNNNYNIIALNTNDRTDKSNPITTNTENINKTQKIGDENTMISMPTNTAPTGNNCHMWLKQIRENKSVYNKINYKTFIALWNRKLIFGWYTNHVLFLNNTLSTTQ